MEFFCYHRDRPGSAVLRDELRERHWSYMDRYATELIARRPTFTDDYTPTGSVHIVDLSDPAAARVFAFDEPNYQAGVYRDVLLRRWRNMLGRTMWDFPGGHSGGSRYLVLGLGAGTDEDPVPSDREALIAYGPLLSDDGAVWLGTAALVRALSPVMARAVLTPSRYAEIEVHNWEFGGRRLRAPSSGFGKIHAGSKVEGDLGLFWGHFRPASVVKVARTGSRCQAEQPVR